MPVQSVMDRLKAKEADLDKGYQRSYETKDEGGLFRTIWKENRPFPLLKVKNGQHLLDILVYLSGPFDPHNPEGTLVHYVDLLVHMYMGPNNDSEICMAQYGKRCAPCEEVIWMRDQDQFDDDDIKQMTAKRRGLYFVVSYDQGEETKGPQLMDLSHHLFHKNLIAQAKQPAALVHMTGEYIKYAHITEGKKIFFTHTGAKAATRIEGIKFYDRDYVIPTIYFNQIAAHPIDTLLRFPDYDEVKKRLLEYRSAGETTTTTSTEQQKPPKSTNPCPANQTFGVSFGEGSACFTCVVKKECMDEKMRLTMIEREGAAQPGVTQGAAGRLPRGDSNTTIVDIPIVNDDDIPF